MEKVCNKCQKLLFFHDFPKSKTNKNGIKSICKKCSNLWKEKWVKNNPEKHAASVKNWALKNADKVKKDNHKHYLKTKDRKIELEKIWRKNNKEKSSKIYKRSRLNNILRVKKYKKEYLFNNPEKNQAWVNVSNAIKRGILPRPTTLKCVECNNMASDYHHHKGYEKQNMLDVIPVCKSCHKLIHIKQLTTTD